MPDTSAAEQRLYFIYHDSTLQYIGYAKSEKAELTAMRKLANAKFPANRYELHKSYRDVENVAAELILVRRPRFNKQLPGDLYITPKAFANEQGLKLPALHSLIIEHGLQGEAFGTRLLYRKPSLERLLR